MWETFFVCKPVCQWLDIRVSFSDGLLVGCSFLKDIAPHGMLAEKLLKVGVVFWPAGIEQM